MSNLTRKIKRVKPLVSVVIVNYNGLKFLQGCLASLLNTRYENFEIVFVDNGSSDGSVRVAKEMLRNHSGHAIIENKANLSFAVGSNIGAKHSHGDYIVFLNNDTEVEPKWLDALIDTMEKDSTVGICQSKLLLLTSRKNFDSAGDVIDRYGVTLRRGGDLREPDVGQYEKVEQVFSARGAAMIIRREVAHRVGMFDPLFSLAYTDLDLCWRARLNGYKVLYVPKSVVYHFGEASTPTATSVFYSTRNRIGLLIKNYNLSNLILNSPGALFIVFGTILIELLKRRPLSSLSRIRGMFSLLANFKYFWKNRLHVQRNIRLVPDSAITHEMSRQTLVISHWRFIYLRSAFKKGKP